MTGPAYYRRIVLAILFGIVIGAPLPQGAGLVALACAWILALAMGPLERRER